jgi:hypothetical protein
MSKKHKMLIATGDCETDPFAPHVIPKPFVWGFYSEEQGYCYFWGKGDSREQQDVSCCEQFIEFLYSLENPHIIYMHNGGKFDFLFLLKYAGGKVKIVNGRILEMHIGIHVLRDSYAAIPIPLGAYKKDDIDYNKLAWDVRDKNRSEILHYLGGDVRYLHEMVTAFRAEFGNVLTIGTAAMHALKEFHEFEEFDEEQDKFFRRFYYGGRNQCFESGILSGNWKVYDVNSMYPACMLNMLHPVSRSYVESYSLTDSTDFVIVEGINSGGLPFKLESGELSFATDRGTYYVTGHELRAALDTGTFEIQRIVEAYTFDTRITFAEFVETYYGKRLTSSAAGQTLLVLFYKLILNSAYGKFCLSPDNFKDWEITEQGDYLDDSMWNLELECGDYILWSKPSTQSKFYNVSTGASITGAARSQLLRGLAQAVRPVYCDTDSIICESFNGYIDSKTLGAWKFESEGDEICIAGKKLYALYNRGSVVTDEKGKPKQASKGSRLTADEIRRVANGGIVKYENPVPAFKLDGNHQFINRNIRKTAWNLKPFGV